MTNRVCCVIPIFGRYKNRHFYAKNSVNSFKKWHKDVDVCILGDDDIKDVSSFTLMRLEFVKKMFTKGYRKVIVLGADSITCSRFDEFLEDDVTPMIVSLDHKMLWNLPFEMKGFFMQIHGVFEWPQINGEIFCVNNPSVIDDIITIVKEKEYIDQVAMNYLYQNDDTGKIKIVDFPYEFTLFTYNNRAKGGLGADCIKDGKMYFGFDGQKIGEFTPIKVWKPIGNKLYNHEGKHVKCFHFCTHIVEDAKKWFNEDTVKFFVNHCDCDWTIPFHTDHYALDSK